MRLLDAERQDHEIKANRRLLQAARPVLDHVEQDLQGKGVALLLVDSEGQVVARVTGQPLFAEHLDAANIGPGQRWNAARPHPSFTAAIAPLLDPSSGRRLGAVALLCQTTGDNPLTEPFAQQIGREILARLVDEARAAERALLEHFVNVRRRSRGPIVAISERNMLTNAAAARLIGDDDQSALWLWADRMLTGQQSSGCVELAGGQTVAARCEAVLDGEETVGALIHFEVRHRQRSSRSGAGWKSLSAAELGVAELVAGGLTNQEAGARLFLSRYTIDFHLRQIYNKLGVRSRVELTRMVIETRARQPLVA